MNEARLRVWCDCAANWGEHIGHVLPEDSQMHFWGIPKSTGLQKETITRWPIQFAGCKDMLVSWTIKQHHAQKRTYYRAAEITRKNIPARLKLSSEGSSLYLRAGRRKGEKNKCRILPRSSRCAARPTNLADDNRGTVNPPEDANTSEGGAAFLNDLISRSF